MKSGNVLIDEQRICNQEILAEYGLNGFIQPKKVAFALCPQINYSCCPQSDQLKIYQRQIQEGEIQNLSQIIGQYKGIINSALFEIHQSSNIAQSLVNKNKLKQTSNCHIQAFQITQFDIGQKLEQFKEIFEKMYKIFTDTERGFYCSLCNAEYNHYFNIEKKEIVISKQQCRSIVTNSLKPLIFIHIHFKYLFQSISDFISCCDSNGINLCTEDNKNPFSFSIDSQLANSIEKCLAQIDQKNWETFCSWICEKFNPVKIDQLFMANWEKYRSLTLYLKKSNNLLISQKTIKSTNQNSNKKQDKQRVLEEQQQTNQSEKQNQTPKNQTVPQKEQIKNQEPIQIQELDLYEEDFENHQTTNKFKPLPELFVQPTIGSKLSLENFKTKISDHIYGINFTYSGTLSIITPQIYDAIKESGTQRLFEYQDQTIQKVEIVYSDEQKQENQKQKETTANTEQQVTNEAKDQLVQTDKSNVIDGNQQKQPEQKVTSTWWWKSIMYYINSNSKGN